MKKLRERELEKLIDACAIRLTRETISEPENNLKEIFHQVRSYQSEYKKLTGKNYLSRIILG